MDGLALARVLHVLAVVVWIGGVSIVTTALLPAVRRGEFGVNWLAAFQIIEHRFVWQARAAIIIVGATGFYMVAQADLWDRFRSAEYWWMHAMVCLWAIFAIGLFFVEPFILDRGLEKWAARRQEAWGRALASALAEPDHDHRSRCRKPRLVRVLALRARLSEGKRSKIRSPLAPNGEEHR